MLPADPLTAPAPPPAFRSYPHVAGCAVCMAYAADRQGLSDTWTLVAATLGHHDSGHRRDTFLAASQHFG